MPCEVRAYLRFSIFRLQFLHRKQVAQKAWSPVRMAKSSILLPQALQLYVQLLQIKEPSPNSSRFASESRRVPHVLHRKQLRCHLLPAVLLLDLLPLKKNSEAVMRLRSSTHCHGDVERRDHYEMGRFENGNLPSSNALPSSKI
jgi:hypothetical protein